MLLLLWFICCCFVGCYLVILVELLGLLLVDSLWLYFKVKLLIWVCGTLLFSFGVCWWLVAGIVWWFCGFTCVVELVCLLVVCFVCLHLVAGWFDLGLLDSWFGVTGWFGFRALIVVLAWFVMILFPLLVWCCSLCFLCVWWSFIIFLFLNYYFGLIIGLGCWGLGLLGVGIVFIMFGFGCVPSEVWLLVGFGVGFGVWVFWGVSFGFPGVGFGVFPCFCGSFWRIGVDII